MKVLRFSYFLIAFTISAISSSLVFTSIANAAPRLSNSVISKWQGPKSGREGAYICTEKKCGGFAVVVYEDDRLSRAQAREFERAKKDRKRFDRYFKLGFRIGNAFKRDKIIPVGSSSSIKVGKLTAIGQAIRSTGRNAPELEHGYVILLPAGKRQHTFAAISSSPAKAKSLAIRFAKGLRF